MLPTIAHDEPAAIVTLNKAKEEGERFATNVIPLALITKDPPIVTPVAAALLMLNTVGDTSIVTVNVLLYTSSAEVGSVPPFHVAVLDQFPVATA
jgi:hypothetical protein